MSLKKSKAFIFKIYDWMQYTGRNAYEMQTLLYNKTHKHLNNKMTAIKL
jgi:hypothetical protein